MNTAYIYSANRVNALSTELLQSADVERLLEAGTVRERIGALRESYLAPFLSQDTDEDVSAALEASVVAAKELLAAVAPDAKLLQVLWYRNDLHNIRVFSKGRLLDWDYATMLPYLSQAGIYAPEYLYEHLTQDTLYRLMPELHDGYHAAWRLAESGNLDEFDTVLDHAYFAGAQRLAQETGDQFVREFIKMETDLHNAMVALRALVVPAFDLGKLFVSGGTFTANQCNTYEQVAERLSNYGGIDFWQAALAEYQEQQHTTALDKVRDNYRLRFVTERVHDMFSVASLFAYALRVQQSAATVRTIMVGADTKVPTDIIRTQLRITY